MAMMDSKESERMSMLLSKLLDRDYTGTQEVVDIRRRARFLQKHLNNYHLDNNFTSVNIITCGSYGEGLCLKGSDRDFMVIMPGVTVMYPGQCIPPNMALNTILYMREADCRPGYVNLQLGQIGQRGKEIHLLNSLIGVKDSIFVSSDIFREQHVSTMNTLTDRHKSSGPSCTGKAHTLDYDYVYSFPCNSWPKEATEWMTRTRLYGWPCQTLIDKIVQSGCHLVPVGDKCSEDTFLQWRISFVTAEVSLVHSFSHIQLQVYTLLKYFLKQIKDTLKETIGDDDILCSYFLKTILFHAIENSSKQFWQEKNLFYCFWFCFNILIAWVRAGFCPNYFIPANNMFQRKVHGLHQQILLDILNNYCQMKWMCLSVGKFFKPSLWESLCNISTQAQLVCPKTAQEIALQKDATIVVMRRKTIPCIFITERTISKVIQSLATSRSDFDEVYTYNHAMSLQRHAAQQVYQDHMLATSNKTRYRSLRKCKHWMIPNASMGTELLYLATFHFLTGNFSKAMEMCKHVMKLASYHTNDETLHPKLEKMFRNNYNQHGHTSDRLQKLFTRSIIILHGNSLHLPHLCLELVKETAIIIIPPLPYALFLSFLCCHELGDLRGREAALHRLIEVQYDDEQGGHKFWIVHTLLGICYQTLGDNHGAIKAYWDSAQSKAFDFHVSNPAIYRIAVMYLCMYVSQRSDRGLT